MRVERAASAGLKAHHVPREHRRFGGQHVDHVYSVVGVLLPDVRVDLRRLLAPHLAVGAHEPRLVAALVLEVPVPVTLQGEPVHALRAVVEDLVGRGLQRVSRVERQRVLLVHAVHRRAHREQI